MIHAHESACIILAALLKAHFVLGLDDSRLPDLTQTKHVHGVEARCG
jgi:hypothetical protein